MNVAPPAGGHKDKGKKLKRQRTEPSGPKAAEAALPITGCPVPDIWRDMALQARGGTASPLLQRDC
ncbi:unnamed protein product [Cuscuta europaea]|uniref:Uncharacterized protein n=1 Tax=Cuscuta europaea TaxID=41803 RepID=A0A9P1EMV3_CUSEU|nr:unnamed protein product [Cuscuta europaea]